MRITFLRAMSLIVTTAMAIYSMPLTAAELLRGDTTAPCDPTNSTCISEAEKPNCSVTACFATEEAQKAYENQHQCIFTSPCGDFNTATQCCGHNPRTGKPAVIDKVFSTPGVLMPGFDSFTWKNLNMACPNRRQNNAPPDDTWSMCAIGERHSPDDHYKIIDIRGNGKARPFCIDGCSTPPQIVATLYGLGTFLKPDRDNPINYSAKSSFLGGCTKHDVCYQTCDKEQAECDDQLLQSMIDACHSIPHYSLTSRLYPTPTVVLTRNHCMNAARVMHIGLTLAGQTSFQKRRQQYCQCC